MDVCLSKQAFFLRIFLEKASPRKRPPLAEMPYQQQWGKCQLAESLSSEHEILVNKTPEAENDIRETGTNFNNETATSSEFAETNAYSTKKNAFY